MVKKACLVVLAGFLVWCWTVPSGAQSDKPAGAPPAGKPVAAAGEAPKAAPEIPKDKQTTLGLYVTAKEAYDLWQKRLTEGENYRLPDPGRVRLFGARAHGRQCSQ